MNLQEKLNGVIESIPDFPKEGILFHDITPIFLHPHLYREVVSTFAEFSKGKIDVVCGIESRGYLFGMGIAQALEVPFILIRKKGKLPPPVIGEKYDLEYGSAEIEMRTGQLQSGQRVLIHDDLLATGGTMAAAAELVKKQGGIISQFSFLIGLEQLHGKKVLEKYGGEIFEILQK